jgi:hypothetical protein
MSFGYLSRSNKGTAPTVTSQIGPKNYFSIFTMPKDRRNHIYLPNFILVLNKKYWTFNMSKLDQNWTFARFSFEQSILWFFGSLNTNMPSAWRYLNYLGLKLRITCPNWTKIELLPDFRLNSRFHGFLGRWTRMCHPRGGILTIWASNYE